MKQVFSILIFFCPLNIKAQDIFAAPVKGFVSWQPAASWEHGLLSGNGTMGTIVMGQPHDETIYLSHSLLYLPQKRSKELIDQASKLDTIRQLMLQGKYADAAKIPVALRKETGYEDTRDPFIPAFNIRLQQEPGNISRYQRSVNFETGEAGVAWNDANGSFQRKTFVSRPDSMIVVSISGTSKINCSIYFEHLPVEWNQWQFVSEHVGEMNAAAEEEQWLTYRSTFKIKNKDAVWAYEGVGRLTAPGGTVKRVGKKLVIQNASSVLLLVKIQPLFNTAISQQDQLKKQLLLVSKNYRQLLTAHAKVHGALFNRTYFNLFASATERKLYSEELLLKGKDTVSPALIERAYDAGRYNIISCTGANPPNLQGLWSGSWTAPWSGSMTNDGNLPTAIAFNLTGNMPELMQSFFDYHERLMKDYRYAAKQLYGCRGIHVPAQATTTGLETDFGETWCLTFWTGAAGWAASFYYDYYQYTQDKNFLKQRAYPFMKEAALFYEDFLQTGTDGKIIFNPSYSPENNPSNNPSQAALNATMDIMIAKQLLRNCISTVKVLNVDLDKIAVWQSLIDKMPAYEVSEEGALREWLWPGIKENFNHRHSSHLYALYDEVAPEFKTNKILQAAAAKVIDEKMKFRIKEDGGEMAFGLVQLGLSAAHLGEAERSLRLVKWLSSKYWANGMASFHNVYGLFNTDISGGLPYVIAQMLAYSEENSISLLPALPVEWKKGAIGGLLLRGNIILKKLSWDNGRIVAVFYSNETKQVNLLLPPGINKIFAGNKKMSRKDQNVPFEINLPAGKDYTIFSE
ncbi:MAG: glycoside hydrolase N-terminal domain-containing protein [Ferruginibacter sp.]